ncbi:MAG: pyridine nucleotide-disulfide oxidoreductase [Deltaproteobacteria bacterium CG_4_10_14_3_um_filter_60_8]|nr:MAG: pyridine nucleotide-disulfide oxidoreductase [Desulfobacterales bacterium CG2_30_60_27]PIP43628.1 MAG: pyridine nucleotide-disulfide oxidoreductase [Deltaproteobacteria bacterium CG23_combo_of_CG06-09_8_20_14_all_60_8]PIY22213.1 MAG: pyridine nucleotide-disulfide oxidoreductase [Deltaproteobacteria bacterium CG_4_10_14_3_um_filter_60_8]
MTEKQQQTGQPDQAEARLAAAFAAMQHAIPLLLFTDPAQASFTTTARQVLGYVAGLSPKITLQEYGLDHTLAQKWRIDRTPAMLFDPEHCHIRWFGVPMGEEGRVLVELLLMLGSRVSGISESSRQVLDQLDTPRQIKLFISPTCPYCPQQAVNAIKAATARPDLVSLEIIDIQIHQELAESYGVHSVPQALANEKLIAMGAQSEELFMASLAKLEQQTVFIPESDAKEIDTDLVIVGGGPAGLTAGIYAARAGLRAVVVEGGLLGGQVAFTPIVENYPGFTQVGGKTLVDIMVTHALEYVPIFPGEPVMEIQAGPPIMVITSRRYFTTRAVLLATGAIHKKLAVPGEDRLAGRGVSYCATCDGPLFKGKKVVLVGGGNAALTEALYLRNVGVDVTLIHRQAAFRAQEHLVQNITANGIPALFNTVVAEIRGQEKVAEVVLQSTVTGESTTLAVDGVFIAIGYAPAVDLAKKIGAELTADGYIKRDPKHRTTVPGVYSAGDVEGGYKQIVTAAGQGAEAALAIFEDLIHPYWQTTADQ